MEIPEYVLDALKERYAACRLYRIATFKKTDPRRRGVEETADAALEYFDEVFERWLKEGS